MLSKFSINRNWLLLGLALLLSFLAFWLSRHYLSQREQELREKFENDGPAMTEVVVAARALATGEAIGAENLAVAQLPSAHIPEDVLLPEDFERLSGALMSRSLSAGRPLLRQYLNGESVERFSDLLKPGERAITLEVDTLGSTNGMLAPGDHVDLIVLAKQEAGEGGAEENQVMVPLMENVKVLAAGRQLASGNQPYGEAGDHGGPDYSTITVAATPKDSRRLLLASAAGKLVPLLRNRADQGKARLAGLGFDELLGGSRASVEVFTGSHAQNGVLKPQRAAALAVAGQADSGPRIWRKRSPDAMPLAAAR